MSLPRGPFKKVEFKPYDSADHPQGRIIIDDKIMIEPKSRKSYLLIQIVAGLQREYPEYKDGIIPVDVLDYVTQVYEIKGVSRPIKTLGSLKCAWREQIRGGKNLILYIKEKGKPEARRGLSAEPEEKKSFLMNQLFPAPEVSREYYFKINVDKPQDLLIENSFLQILAKAKKNLELQANETDATPESASVIDRYMTSLSTDFRMRNIVFFDQYKDMFDDQVYVERRLRQPIDALCDPPNIYRNDLSFSSDGYQLLLQNRKIIIQGEPGSGKTILLRHLAVSLAAHFKDDQLIPLYVELRGYNPVPTQSLYSYAIDVAVQTANFTDEEKQEFQRAISNNKARLVFLLDAYEEARNNLRLVQQIRSLPTISRIVITSRRNVETSRLAPDLQLEIEPFDISARRLFIEKAAPVFGMEERLRDRVIMDTRCFSPISHIVQNPLFLLCICFIAKPDEKLPLQPIAILRQVRTTMLDHFVRDQPSDLSEALEYLRDIKQDGTDIFDSIYGRLAFDHLSKAELEFSDSSVINLVETAVKEYKLTEYRLPIRNAVMNCGVLTRGSPKNSYSFIHPIFMEYFTAQQLTRTTEWKQILLRKYLDPSWRNVILLFIAQFGLSKFPAIYELLTQLDDYFHRGLLLAAESISGMSEYPSLTEEIIEKLCKLSDKHLLGDVLIRSLFVNQKRLQSYESYTSPSKTDRYLTRLVIDSLVKRGTAPYFDRCVDQISSPPYGKVGKFKQFLCQYGKKINPTILLDTFVNQKDRWLRGHCALALGMMAPDIAETKLTETLLNKEEDRALRKICVMALEDVDSTRSVEALIQILRDNTDDVLIRQECAFTLPHWPSREVVRALGTVLARTDDNLSVRGHCALSLGEIASVEVRSPLIRGLIHESDSELRELCALGLAKRGGEENVGGIEKVLLKKDEDLELRILCVGALVKLRSRNSLPVLMKILTHEDNPLLQSECAGALARIDQNFAKNVLTPILEDPKAGSGLRCTSAHRLFDFGTLQEKKLLGFLRNPHIGDRFRHACAYLLGKLRSVEAIPELIHLLRQDEDHLAHREPYCGDIRHVCARALASIASDECLQELKKTVLESEEIQIRSVCIKAIAQIGSQSAVTALQFIHIEMERRNEEEVAWYALEDLATIPLDTSLDFCIQVFRNKVLKINEESAHQLPFVLENDPENRLRRLLKCIRALAQQLTRIVTPQSLNLSDVTKE